jgi:hypothetical protein
MRKRNDTWDKPWVTIAAIVGVIAVVVIALVFFLGGTGGSAGQSSSGQAPAVPGSGAASSQTTISSVGVPPSVIITQSPVNVPGQGVFVKVSYIGGFAGVYGVNSTLQKVRNSGERVFAIDNATGNFKASFRKEDGSTRHELVVEIWKDGKVLKFGKNSTPYGEVSISYSV